MVRKISRRSFRRSNLAMALASAVVVLIILNILTSGLLASKSSNYDCEYTSIRLPQEEKRAIAYRVSVDTRDICPEIVPDGLLIKLPEANTVDENIRLEISEARHIPNSMPLDLTDGRVSSEFGMRKHPISGKRRMHTGIDLAKPSGTPVIATADGKVSFAGRKGGYGNLVIIDHLSEFSTRYAHLSRIKTKAGEFVKRGDIIGLVGSTGASTGPHLHYEVRVNGDETDPRRYLPANFEAVVKGKQKSIAIGSD